MESGRKNMGGSARPGDPISDACNISLIELVVLLSLGQ